MSSEAEDRKRRLVEQVVAAAFQTFEEHGPNPEPVDKAAMLLRGITQGHPFNDGNKRTGFFTAAYNLRLVRIPLPDHLPADEVVALSVRVSGGEFRDVTLIARELRRLWGYGRRVERRIASSPVRPPSGLSRRADPRAPPEPVG